MTSPRRSADASARRRIVAALILLLLGILHPITTHAQEAEEPTTAHTHAFAQHVTLNLTLPPEAQAQEVTLFLRAGQRDTEVHLLTPDDGEAVYRRDLRKDPLPPFTEITYWWRYEDATGAEQSTPTTRFLYEDNRFDWEQLSEPEGNITLYWVDGSMELMTTGLDIARTALNEMGAHLERPETEKVLIYVYPSQTNLDQALRLSGTAWVAGEAHPEVGVLLVAIPPNEQAISRMKTLLPHELTHLVLYRQLGAQGYRNLPSWLNEGLASYFEQRPDPTYAVALERAEATNDWIPLETLCHSFYQMTGDWITLAYAESHSVTRYIVEAYGWSGMQTLLSSYADGLNCTRGVEKALRVDLITLEREWKVWLSQDGEVMPSQARVRAKMLITLRDLAPWLMLALFLTVPGVLMALVPHRSRPLA